MNLILMIFIYKQEIQSVNFATRWFRLTDITENVIFTIS